MTIKPTVKVYLAKKMSGRTGKELVTEAFAARAICPLQIETFDPVLIEGVPYDDAVLSAGADLLAEHWKRDKRAIREAHVVIDTTGPEKSAGVEHEVGYARYCLWKPVIRVWPGLKQSIARIEDDFVVENLKEAYQIVLANWGTRRQRLIWRTKLLSRCLFKWIFYQLREFK